MMRVIEGEKRDSGGRVHWRDFPLIGRILTVKEPTLEPHSGASNLRLAISKTERILRLTNPEQKNPNLDRRLRNLVSARNEILKELPPEQLLAFMRTAILILIRNVELRVALLDKLPDHVPLGTAKNMAERLMLDYDRNTIKHAFNQTLMHICIEYPRVGIKEQGFALSLTVD